MSSEFLGPETPEHIRPVSLTDFETYLEDTVVDSDGHPLDPHAFNSGDYQTRTRYSLALAQHVHEQVTDINTDYVSQHRGLYPILPERQVEYCIRDILSTAERIPHAKRDILNSYRPLFEQNRHRYLQIIKVIQLGRELQAEGHPLACCATDVLLGYGMAIARGVK